MKTNLIADGFGFKLKYNFGFKYGFGFKLKYK